MNLDQLETFLALIRCGSFTRAAEELAMTQPAVSRHIQRLEEDLGVCLLTQRRGHIELSAAGERLREYADEVVAGYQRLQEVLRHEASPLIGTLNITASSAPGEFVVPGLVAGFTALHPQVAPRILMADSSEVAAQLRDRRCDVGFCGVEAPGRDLHHQEIGTDEIVLAVPSGHPFGKRPSIEVRELAGQPFLAREAGSGTHQTFLAALAELGLELPAYRTVMVLGSTQAIISAVQGGYGMGLVSSLALEGRGHGGPIGVRVSDLALRRSLHMVVERDRPLGPVPAAFVTWVLLCRGVTPVPSGPPASETGQIAE
ncbi:MAG: selenium metabolism-associated LysR family transcriptional regulator [Actinomycetota bacterium]